jgi:hypothetical protein
MNATSRDADKLCMTAAVAETIDDLSPPPEPSPAVLQLKEVRNGSPDWTLALYPAHLALGKTSEVHPYVIVREEVMKSALLSETPRLFVVAKPIKTNFKLSETAATALAGWIGKPALARYYLTHRYGLVLPAAILWMFSSIPLPGSPESGAPALTFDPWGLALGVLLAGAWVWMKLRPNPVLFLIDSIWFLSMGAHLVAGVLNGRSKVWLVLVPLLLWMVFTGVKCFIRFRGTEIPKPTR